MKTHSTVDSAFDGHQLPKRDTRLLGSAISFFFFAVFISLMPMVVRAQETVEIGTGTSTVYYPMPGFYGFQYDVYIYTPDQAEALEQGGIISEIAYNLSSSSSTSGATFTIYMKDVDPSYVLSTSTTFSSYIAGATQVYHTSSFTSTTGWNTYSFSTPFQHVGGQALLVAVRSTGCSTSGGCSRNCYYTAVSSSHWYKRADSSDPGTSVSGSTDTYRSNIRLTFTPDVGDCELAGAGTSSSPYLIYNQDDLVCLRSMVNGGTNNVYATLMNDITLSNTWMPIGTSSNPFSGVFNGGSHTISNLVGSQGLFGYTENAVVQNVSVSGSVSGAQYVAGVIGYAVTTTIQNCHNYASVTSSSTCAGGVVAYAHLSPITNCTNNGSVTSTSTTTGGSGVGIGGIVGYANGQPLSNEEVVFNSTFESGLDGWTLANGSATNVWMRGTATSNLGSYSLYVSNDGSSNSYSTSSSSTVWFYRTVTIPEDAVLSFNWKAAGESTSWDFTNVYLAEGTYTPTANTTSGSFTLPSGLISLGSVLNVQTSWQTAEYDLSQYAGGTYTICFVWRNDGSGGSTPPAAIDNIRLAAVHYEEAEVVFCSNCTNTGTITSNSSYGAYTSGVVGQMEGMGSIEYCENEGNVTGRYYVGGVVGCSKNTTSTTLSIHDCSNSGTIDGEKHVGGIVGAVIGTQLSNCDNSGSITSNTTFSSSRQFVGGVVGSANYFGESSYTTYGTVQSISNCSNSGNVAGYQNTGGIAGLAFNNTTLTQNTNTGAISSLGFRTGGILGYAYTNSNAVNNGGVTITHNFNQGTVTSSSTYLGGIVGYAAGYSTHPTISANLNAGQITSSSTGTSYVAGIVGYSSTYDIDQCVNIGEISDVTTSSSYMGGIAGYITSTTLTNSLNAGNIRGNNYASGIVGTGTTTSTCLNVGAVVARGTSYVGAVGGSAAPTNCYFDKQVCTNENLYASTAAATSAASLSTAQLTSGELPSGFSSNNWVATSGMYPRPASVASSAVAVLAATPFFLQNNETIDAVSSCFTANTNNNVQWSSSDETVLEESDGNYIVRGEGVATLTARKNNLSKSTALSCARGGENGIDISIASGDFCGLSPLTLVAELPSGTSALGYQWYLEDEAIPGATELTVTLNAPQRDTYCVLEVQTAACPISARFDIPYQGLGDVTISGPDVCLVEGSDLSLEVSSSIQSSVETTASQYLFTAHHETYQPLAEYATAMYNSSSVDDSQYQIVIPSDFDFSYSNTPVTSLYASTNGLLKVNGTMTSHHVNNLSSNTNDNYMVLAPMWDDLGSYYIYYNTSGVAPNRVLTVEWRSYNLSSSTSYPFTYQVKLHEGTNAIDFCYGDGLPSVTSGSASIGLNTAEGDFLSVTPSATPTASSEVVNNSIASSHFAYLTSGTVYSFSAPSDMTCAWTANGQPIGENSNVLSTTIDATTNYVCTVSNSFGCQVSTEAFQVRTMPELVVNVPGAACDGEEVTISVVNASDYESFLWSNQSSESSIQITPAGRTLFSVDVTTADGCENSYEGSVLALTTPDVTLSTTTQTTCLQIGSDISMTIEGGEGMSTIGSDVTTTYMTPVNNYYKNTYSQILYTAEELGGGGDIRSIGFQYAYSTAMTSKTTVSIYMGETSMDHFASNTTSDFVPGSDLTLVYSGNLNCSQGWNDFTLSTPFSYTGNGNLVVAILDNSNGYNSSSYIFNYTATAANTVLSYYSDSYSTSNISSPNASMNKMLNGNRPNTRFYKRRDLEFAWYENENLLQENTRNLNVQATGDATYKAVVSCAGGYCPNTLTMSVGTMPRVEIVAEPETDCPGEEISLSLAHSQDFISADWSNNASSLTTVINPTENGTYSVSATTNSGCVGSASRQINVLQTPHVTYSIEPQNTICLQEGTEVVMGFETSQQMLVVGTGTTTDYHTPVNNFYNNTYSQMIYKAEELGVSGQIYSLGFQYAYSSALTSKSNVTIYMGETSLESFSGISDFLHAADLTQVYSGSLNCSLGWNDFTLTTPYNYSGNGNLVIAVQDNSGSYNGTAYTFYHTATNENTVAYLYSDSYQTTNLNSPNSSMSFSLSANRPNIRVQADYVQNYVWTKDGALLQETTPQISFAASENAIYEVVVSEEGTPCQTTVRQEISVMPVVAITAEPVAICGTGSSTLTLQNEQNFVEMNWNTGEEGSTLTVSPSATTQYSISVTDHYGCIGSSSIEVPVERNPVFTISEPIPAATCVQVGSDVTLTLSGGETLNTLGTGTATTYLSPVNNYFNYSYNQLLYTADEIGGPTAIRSIGFQYGYSSATTSKTNVAIYMGETSKSAFTGSAVSDFVDGSDLTLVYSGSLNFVQGWNDFTLSQPFSYSGNGNLVVAILDRSGSYNGSSYVFKYTTTPVNTVLASYSDSDQTSSVSSPNSSMSRSCNANRPNTRFLTGYQYVYTCLANGVEIPVEEESITTPITENTTFEITAINPTGHCPVTASQTVTVMPAVSIVASPEHACPDETVTLSISDPESFSTATWSNQTEGLTTTIQPIADGVYSVEALSHNGCLGSSSIEYTLLPHPVLSFSAEPANTLCMQEGSALTLSVESDTRIPVIGTGTGTTYNTPVNNYYHYTYSQMLFSANEVGGAGMINSIGYEYAYSSAMTLKNNVTIYMGETDKSAFAGTSTTEFVMDLTPVYSGSLNCSQGWNDFTLQTPFNYSGNGNLVVAVLDNSNNYNGRSYTFRYTPTTTNSVLSYYSDSYQTTNIESPNTSMGSTVNGNRPNTRFNMGYSCTYEWSANGETLPFTGAVLDTVVSENVTYSVAVSAAGSTCVRTFTQEVTTMPRIAAIATPDTICAGASSQLAVSNADDFVDIVWLDINQTEVSPELQTSYTVVAEDANGCVGTKNVSVVVYNIPDVSLVSTPQSTECVTNGEFVTLNVGGDDVSSASHYTMSYRNEQYVDILNLPNIAVTEIPLSSISNYDDYMYSVTLPFVFEYCNRSYTTVVPTTNGTLYFGSGTTSRPSFSSNTYNVVGAFMRDAQISSSVTPKYGVMGTAPNRIFVSQFDGWGELSNTNVSNTLKYQIWLYEGSNRIEVHYGTTPTATISGTYVGLGSYQNSVYDYLCVSTDGSALSTVQPAAQFLSTAQSALTNRIITYTPPVQHYYAWTVNGEPLSTASSTISLLADDDYEYQVTVSNPGGYCPTTLTQNITQVRPVEVSAEPAIICQGDTSVLSVVNEEFFASVEWESGETASTIGVSPSALSAYSVSATSANGCQTASAVNVDVAYYPEESIISSLESLECLDRGTPLSFTYHNGNIAQVVEDYQLSVADASYVDIVEIAGNNTVSTNTFSSYDSGIREISLPDGFTFTFAGNDYSSVNISTNGQLFFGSGSTTLYSLTGNYNYVGAYITDGRSNTSLNFQYTTVGTAPNRIMIVQNDGYSYYNYTTSAYYYQYQVWLYESSNKIEVHYGTVPNGTATSATSVAIGLRNYQGTSSVLSVIPAANASDFTTVLGSQNSVSSTLAYNLSNKVLSYSPGSVYEYQWRANGTLLESETQYVEHAPMENTTYELAVTNTAANCRSTFTRDVTVVPDVAITPYPALTCPDGEVTVTGQGAQSYEWYPANATQLVLLSTDSTVTLPQSSYVVKGTDENGCHNTFSFDVEEGIPAAGAIANETTTGCLSNGSSVILSSTEDGYGHEPNYRWYRDGQLLENSNMASLEVSAEQLTQLGLGTYTFTREYWDGCSDHQWMPSTGVCTLYVEQTELMVDIQEMTVDCGAQLTITPSFSSTQSNTILYYWYADEACTQLLAVTENAYTTPELYTGHHDLYVKARPYEAGPQVAPRLSGMEEVVSTYTTIGAYEYEILPNTDSLKLEVWGAQGGYRLYSTYGGKGGYSVGTMPVLGNETLYVYVGGSGNTGGTSGGYNGGGSRATYNGGGGASDIRLNGTSLYNRIIVAGGGGSDGSTSKQGMYGGGTLGGTTSQSFGSGGQGATQTAGGSGSSSNSGTQGQFGQGGRGYYYSSGYAGAGGGGWYGGAGSYPDSSGDDDRGGGGGSGYVWTSATSSDVPANYLVSSDYYLRNAQTIGGDMEFPSILDGEVETGHEGNGCARITAYVYVFEPDTIWYCESAVQHIQIDVNPIAEPTLDDVVAVCGDRVVLAPTATPSVANDHLFYWYADAECTALLTVASQYTTEQLAVGEYDYYVKQVDYAYNAESTAMDNDTVWMCYSDVNHVIVTVEELYAPEVSDGAISCGTDGVLSVSGNDQAQDVIYSWYSDANCTQQIATGRSLFIPQLLNDTTVYVKACRATVPISSASNQLPEQVDSYFCTSEATEAHISVSVIEAPFLPFDGPVSLCQGMPLELMGATMPSEDGEQPSVVWYTSQTGGSIVGVSDDENPFEVTPDATITYYAAAATDLLSDNGSHTLQINSLVQVDGEYMTATGVSFGLATGRQSMSIDSLRIAPAISSMDVGTPLVNVYYMSGSCEDAMADESQWTLVQQFQPQLAAGRNIELVLDQPLELNAHELYSFFVSANFDMYINNFETVHFGDTLSQDGRVTLTSGYGREVGHESTFSDENLIDESFYGAISYTLSGDLLFGCQSTERIPVEVIVDTPSIAATAILSDDYVCNGEAIELTTDAVLGTNATYEWYQGRIARSNLISNEASITVNPTEDTEYWFRIVSDNCETTEAISKLVGISTTPSLGQIEAGDHICHNSPLNVEEPEVEFFGPTVVVLRTWQISADDVNYEIWSDTQNVPYSKSGSYVRYMVVTPCDTLYSNSVQIVVDTLPVLNTLPQDFALCDNNTLDIDALNILSSTVGCPESVVTWHRFVTNGAEVVEEDFSEDTQFPYGNLYNIYVSIESHCAVLYSDTVSVDVFAVPTVGALQPLGGPVCAGTILPLLAPDVNENGSTASTSWQVASSLNDEFVEFDITEPVPYSMNMAYVRYAAENECGTTYSNPTQIIVNDKPTISALDAEMASCSQVDFPFSLPTVEANGNAITYQTWQWIVGADTTDVLLPVTVSFEDWNNTELRYVAENGCGFTSSNISTVVVHPEHHVSATAQFDVYCPVGEFTLTAQSDVASASFAWTSDADAGIAVADQAVGVCRDAAIGTHTYTVTAEDEFGCQETAEATVTIRNIFSYDTVTVCLSELPYTYDSEVPSTFAMADDYEVAYPIGTGCDSIVYLHLSVTPVQVNRVSYGLCGAGDSYYWDVTGETYTTETRDTIRIPYADGRGCDSVIYYLNVNMGQPTLTASISDITIPMNLDTTLSLQCFTNCSNNNSAKLAIEFELYKDDELVNNVEDFGSLYIATDFPTVNHTFGSAQHSGTGSIPGTTFSMYNYDYDYYYQGFLNNTMSHIVTNWHESGVYRMVFRLVAREGGNDYSYQYNETDRIGGAGSHTIAALDAVELIIRVTDNEAETEEPSEPTAQFDGLIQVDTNNMPSSIGELADFTITVGMNGETEGKKVAMDYEIYHNGELVSHVADYGTANFSTWYAPFNRAIGRDLTNGTGSIPTNSFKVIYYQYQYFYADFWNSTVNTLTANWNEPGEYKVVFRLFEREGGNDLPQLYDNVHYVGGAGSVNTNLLDEQEIVMTISAPAVEANEEIAICESELPYSFRDTVFEVGTLSQTLDYLYNDASSDYDTLIHVSLTIHSAASASIEETACGSYEWNGTLYTESGEYVWTGQTVNGCDSVVTLQLTINDVNSVEVSDTACGSYEWNGTVYTESGDYIWNGQNASGCDSIVTLHLTIHKPVHEAETMAVCNEYEWNGTRYTESGLYTFDHEDANGCTQVDTLHLTIYTADTVEVAVTACGSYEWNGTIYTESGDYTWTGQNANGCDSVVTLILNILNVDNVELSESACGSYEWNGTVYTESGDYTWSGQNANGCDSVVSLHLTIYNPTPETVTMAICTEYEWNGTIYTESGLYTFEHEDANGCTQVDTLLLTIYSADAVELAEIACGSYEWNGTIYTESGDYTWTGQNANGCDSVVTLHLTINQPAAYEFSANADDYYTWNGISYTVSGDYTQNFTAANGCDSIATLHLTISNPHTDGVPFILANAIANDTVNMKVFANGMDENTRVSVNVSLYKDGALVQNMSDECGGFLYIGTDYNGQLIGRGVQNAGCNIPANSFTLASVTYHFFNLHYYNGRQNLITNNFTIPGDYELVFELMTEEGGNEMVPTYNNNGVMRRVGGVNSTEGAMICLASVQFTIEDGSTPSDDGGQFPAGSPTLTLSSNDITAQSSIDTLTCDINAYDINTKVAINYTVLRDGEPMSMLTDYGTITLETWYGSMSRYVGKALLACEGSMPSNTFRPMASYAYNYFYLDFLSSTRNRIQASWNHPGEYTIIFDLVEMTAGSDLALTWTSGRKVGGRQAQATGLLLATDTLRYHIAASSPAPTGISETAESISELSVFPNPARDNVRLSMPELEQGSEVVITDVNGKEVFRTAAKASTMDVTVTGWAQGVYFVTLRSSSNTQTVKLVVTK